MQDWLLKKIEKKNLYNSTLPVAEYHLGSRMVGDCEVSFVARVREKNGVMNWNIKSLLKKNQQITLNLS